MPDMAGPRVARLCRLTSLAMGEMKMPEAIFAQTISGDYVANERQCRRSRHVAGARTRTTLRPGALGRGPAASVFLDCYHRDGSPVEASPRGVLRNVLGKYEAQGWIPVVAPEVEFYLLNPHSDPNAEAEPPEGRLGWTEGARQPYSIDTMNDFDPFINESTNTAKRRAFASIPCHRKWARRSSKSISCTATRWNSPTRCSCSNARFAKPRSNTRCTRRFLPNRWPRKRAVRCIFTRALSTTAAEYFFDDKGEPSELFYGFFGGLQRYMPTRCCSLRPYVNSYRRFEPRSSPVNLAWAIDNRTVGLRVPDSPPRRAASRTGSPDPTSILISSLRRRWPVGTWAWSRAETDRTPPWAVPTAKNIQSASAYLFGDRRVAREQGDAQHAGRDVRRPVLALKEDEYKEFQEIITP